MNRYLFAALLLILGLAGLPERGAALTSGDPLTEAVMKPWFGDYSAMKKDKVVRVLVPYSITGYYLNNGAEKGIYFEYMRELEKFINRSTKKEINKTRIVMIPTRRDELIDGLVGGFGDLAVAGLTITPSRLEQVDFTDPVLLDVAEVVVTDSGAADLQSVSDLSGLEIHVRESSSYFDSLNAINKRLEAKGHAAVKIVAVNESIEDEDLLEMVNTGIVPATVVDDYIARLWSDEFKNTKVHGSFFVRSGAEIAWAFRKDSPELKSEVNAFIKKVKPGTKLGNILLKRYFSDVDRLVNPKALAYREKLKNLRTLFETYGKKYDIDPMLLAAQAFQESRFNPTARSRAGAVGIMQLLPSTARDKNVNIKNFESLEGNIEAGAKYMRFLADHYFGDASISEFNRILFAFAAYNAGPNRVARVRKKADNPEVWFDSVEWQVARAAGVEPIRYVKNIYIYYVISNGLTAASAN